jgi:hypothetical protein
MLVARGLWALTLERAGSGTRWTLNLALIGLQALALVAGGVLVALGTFDWWFWLLGVGLLVIQVIAFRSEWPSGLSLLGVLGAGAGMMLYASWYWSFAGASVPVSFALLSVVTLLSIEWLARKLLRLA